MCYSCQCLLSIKPALPRSGASEDKNLAHMLCTEAYLWNMKYRYTSSRLQKPRHTWEGGISMERLHQISLWRVFLITNRSNLNAVGGSIPEQVGPGI